MECYGNLLLGASGVEKDGYYISEERDVFALCEGGSTFYTEKAASKYCIEAFKKTSYKASGLTPFDYLKQCIIGANDALIEKSQREGRLFTSSVLGAVLEDHQLYISGVGNTEAFLIQGTYIKRVLKTKRKYHNELEYGMLTEEEAEQAVKGLPERLKPYFDNYLPDIIPDIAINKAMVRSGDILIFCSKLIYTLVSQEELVMVMKNNTLEAAAEKLFSLVYSRYPKYWIGDRTLVVVKF